MISNWQQIFIFSFSVRHTYFAMDALGKENANPEVFTSEVPLLMSTFRLSTVLHTLGAQVADRVDQIPIDPQDNERDELDAMEVFGASSATLL